MFVRNFYMKLATDLCYTVQTDGPSVAGIKGAHQLRTDRTSLSLDYTWSYLRLDYNSSIKDSAVGYGVAFGDGNTPVTFDDYKLSGHIITGLTVSYNKVLSHAYDDRATMTVVYTITNNNAEAVTIREIGMFGHSRYTEQSSSEVIMLMDRTVLDSPVTIEPNGVGQVTYTINLNYPV